MNPNERALLLCLAEVVAGLAWDRELIRSRRHGSTTTTDGPATARPLIELAEAVRAEAQASAIAANT